MKTYLKSIALVSGLMLGTSAMAAPDLHNTKWTKYKNGKASAIIKFTKRGGVLQANIIKIVDKRSKGKKVCTVCKGKFKNKKLTGARVMWGIKAVKGKKYHYVGRGYQPEEGRGYKAKITVQGSKLKIVGSVGPFSKTQYLRRAR